MQIRVQKWDRGDAEELLEGKSNFNRRNLKGGKIGGRWKLKGSLVSCMSLTQRRRAPLPTAMQRKGSRGISTIYNTLSRKHEGLPFIINRISIRSFSFIRFQNSSKDLINNSLFLSVIFICELFLDFENTSWNNNQNLPLSIFIWEIRQVRMIFLPSK